MRVATLWTSSTTRRTATMMSRIRLLRAPSRMSRVCMRTRLASRAARLIPVPLPLNPACRLTRLTSRYCLRLARHLGLVKGLGRGLLDASDPAAFPHLRWIPCSCVSAMMIGLSPWGSSTSTTRVGRETRLLVSLSAPGGEHLTGCFGVGIREGPWCSGSERPAGGPRSSYALVPYSPGHIQTSLILLAFPFDHTLAFAFRPGVAVRVVAEAVTKSGAAGAASSNYRPRCGESRSP